jgi:capsule polysaccharide export protein KpsC/LpsZ
MQGGISGGCTANLARLDHPPATWNSAIMVIATNPTIAAIPHLDVFVADHPRAVVGWGRKRSGRIAAVLARLLGRPRILLEDGFIRSVERRGAPISLIVDDIGVYYDAGAPSRIERQIARGATSDQAIRARALRDRWRRARISKYNHAPDYAGDLPRRYVLVVDQTAGDLSLRLGRAAKASFSRMLQAALEENPKSLVVVKVHPDRFSHAKHGNFAPAELAQPRVRVIAAECHAVRLLEAAEAVYTVTSLMGFEGLLWGKRVRCFGMPFYAGWGLTEDVLPVPRRRGAGSLEALVHAALVECVRYVDPATGGAWSVEQAIDHVAAARATRSIAP